MNGKIVVVSTKLHWEGVMDFTWENTNVSVLYSIVISNWVQNNALQVKRSRRYRDGSICIHKDSFVYVKACTRPYIAHIVGVVN